MAKRRCKCNATGEWGTSDIFYKAPNGKYYKDEQLYLTYKKESESFDTVAAIIFDVLGWKAMEGCYPKKFFSKLNMLHGFGWSNVSVVAKETKSELKAIMERNDYKFKDELSRAVYLMAVIRTKCFEAEQKKNRMSNSKRGFTAEREVLPEYYDEPDIMHLKPRSAKDISKWLD